MITNDMKNEELKMVMIDAWIQNSFNDIEIITSNNDSVIVTPCCYADVKSIENVEYYLTYGGCDPHMGGENLDELVDKFINYTELANKTESEKNKLKEYFNKHIKGHTKTELEIGNACYSSAWDLSNDHTSIGEVLKNNEFIVGMAVRFGKTETEIKNSIELSDHVSFYSDWYKEYYGYRPKHSLVA
jgi:hypothetical protein